MDWMEFIQEEAKKNYMKELQVFVKEEYQKNTIYPPMKNIFHAFEVTPLEKTKVVILGQDPYHEPNQAMGLSFSVPEGVAIPKSLINIYKELESDLGIHKELSGDLTHWAKEGVLLLNSILTVRAHEAGSHRNKGWEIFTDHAIECVSQYTEHTVFILWGNYAKSKASLIDESKHLIIKSAHPSPLSCYNGFFGSKPFSKTNEYLEKYGKGKIEW